MELYPFSIQPIKGNNCGLIPIMLDTSEMTVQHDKLKQMIDHAVQDAIGAAMKVVSVRLEASLKNIFTEHFEQA